MPMLCDNCHQKEAIIHVQEVRPDGNKTINLCAECALMKLADLNPQMADAHKFLFSLLSLFDGKDAKVRLEDIFNRAVDDVAEKLPDVKCPTCGQTLADFLKKHRLGCEACAETFGSQLKDYLEVIHNTELPPIQQDYTTPEHPAQPPADTSQFDTEKLRNDELARLRRELDIAIKTENYEKAARLRDMIAEFLPVSGTPQE